MQTICFALGRTAREISRMMDGNLRRLGLTRAQVQILGFLDWKTDRGEVCSQKDICRECSNTRPSSVTSLLQTLERRGYVVRRTDTDARVKRVELTEEGVRVARSCRNFMAYVNDSVVESFTEEEKKIFADLLTRAAENLARYAESVKE